MKSREASRATSLCKALDKDGCGIVAPDEEGSSNWAREASGAKVGLTFSKLRQDLGTGSALELFDNIGDAAVDELIRADEGASLGFAKIGGGEGQRKLDMACTAGGISWIAPGSGEPAGVDLFSVNESGIAETNRRFQ